MSTKNPIPPNRSSSISTKTFVDLKSISTGSSVPYYRESSILTITFVGAIETRSNMPPHRSSSVVTSADEGNIVHDLCNDRNVTTEISINIPAIGSVIITTFEDAISTVELVPLGCCGSIITITFKDAINTGDGVPAGRHGSLLTYAIEGNFTHDLCDNRNVTTNLSSNIPSIGRVVMTTFESAISTVNSVPEGRSFSELTTTFEGPISTGKNVPVHRSNSISTAPFKSTEVTGVPIPHERYNSIDAHRPVEAAFIIEYLRHDHNS